VWGQNCVTLNIIATRSKERKMAQMKESKLEICSLQIAGAVSRN
jgi:hypothetical protein